MGAYLGSQPIERQLPSGAVFVPLSAAPVLVQVNMGGSRLRGVESEFDASIHSSLTLNATFGLVRAEDRATGLHAEIPPRVLTAREVTPILGV